MGSEKAYLRKHQLSPVKHYENKQKGEDQNEKGNYLSSNHGSHHSRRNIRTTQTGDHGPGHLQRGYGQCGPLRLSGIGNFKKRRHRQICTSDLQLTTGCHEWQPHGHGNGSESHCELISTPQWIRTIRHQLNPTAKHRHGSALQLDRGINCSTERLHQNLRHRTA